MLSETEDNEKQRLATLKSLKRGDDKFASLILHYVTCHKLSPFYFVFSRTELAHPVMVTIFVVIKTFCSLVLLIVTLFKLNVCRIILHIYL